jgi:hypothetical protein
LVIRGAIRTDWPQNAYLIPACKVRGIPT